MSITVIGLGGCGSRITNQINKNFNDFQFKIIDTNNKAKTSLPKQDCFYLGNGNGSGMNPALALQLAKKESKEKELSEFLKKPEVAILICGAGGTGQGLVDFVSNLLIKKGTLPIVFLVKPFDMDDRDHYFNQMLKTVKQNKYSYSIISNQNIADLQGDLKINEIYQKPNEVLSSALQTIADLKNSNSIDFNDLKAILSYKGYFLSNTIKAKNWQECFKKVISPELLDFGISKFEGGLIKIQGSPENLPSFNEFQNILKNEVLNLKTPQTKFKIDYQETQDKETTVNLILTGINNQIL